MKTKFFLFLTIFFSSCELLIERLGPVPCDVDTLACESEDVLRFCNERNFEDRTICQFGCLADLKTCGACGDGQVDTDLGEVCDDGDPAPELDGCDSLCQIDPGFSCNDEQPSVCTANCGNNVEEANFGEQCDDGNIIANDGCSPNCLIEICGDGIINFSEGFLENCDDANSFSNDGCSSSCSIEDGFLCTGEPSDCIVSCGNNVEDFGETCDDGNQNDGDGCDQNCQEEICGNNIVQINEECDDGCAGDGCSAGDNNDGCAQDCITEICGDGITNFSNGVPEECDDANNNNGDGCDNNCNQEVCGDGIITLDEECDDGNTTPGDGCDQLCQSESCGNTVVEAGEACDDGNQVDNDECNNSCQFTCTLLANNTLASFRDEATGNCYILPTQIRDWNAAKNDCAARNNGSNFQGHLVTITTGRENAIVRALTTPTELWVGLTDQNDGTTGSQEGRFRWVTGERLSPFMNFRNGEPNGGGGENCVSFFPNEFTWNDAPCSSQRPYVCEFDFGRECGNGILEQGEVCDDNNTTPGDGCSADCQTFNCTEEAAGAVSGTTTLSDGCFVLIETNRNFTNAQNQCVSRGGFLATITTSAENAVLDQLENPGNDSFWIGAQDGLTEGAFGWVNGETFSFSDFAAFQPDNSNNEDCIEYTNNDNWNDLNCGTTRFQVCEF